MKLAFSFFSPCIRKAYLVAENNGFSYTQTVERRVHDMDVIFLVYMKLIFSFFSPCIRKAYLVAENNGFSYTQTENEIITKNMMRIEGLRFAISANLL